MHLSIPTIRLPFIALAMLSLLIALWAGLVRLGWNLPPLARALPGAHGPLMVAGFVGTLVALERAAALNRPWAYAAPLLSGLGSLVLLAGLPFAVGPVLITLGSGVLVVIFVLIVRRQPALFTLTMFVGAWLWFFGNALWLFGWSVYQVVLWWAGYLILTVAGERLELGRMQRLPRAIEILFFGLVGFFVLGLILSLFASGPGTWVSGLALVGLALWLLRYDIARRTVRQLGLTRYIALSMLSGYFWLGLGGALALLLDRPFASSMQYDALLHSLFLGFVISMIFGHAPIILPALLGRGLQYSLAMYSQLLLLHLSLLLRVAGDLLANPLAREWGGLLNVIAVLLFLANTMRGLINARIPVAASAVR